MFLSLVMATIFRLVVQYLYLLLKLISIISNFYIFFSLHIKKNLIVIDDSFSIRVKMQSIKGAAIGQTMQLEIKKKFLANYT